MKEGDVIVSVESFFTQKESYESIQAPEECIVYVKKLYFHRIFFYLFRREETEKKQVELARI